MSVHPCPAPKCKGVDGNAVLTEAPLCAHHTTKVGQALAEMSGLYADCATAMLPGQRADNERVTTSSSSPLPINGDARAAQEDMAQLLRGAEVSYRLHRGWALTARRSEYQTVVTLGSWAAKHLDGLLALDVLFGVRVLKLKHRIRSLLGEVALVHRLGAPCPDCDVVALVREDGSSMVQCRACGIHFPEEHYGLMARMLADSLAKPTVAARKPLDATSAGFGW